MKDGCRIYLNHEMCLRLKVQENTRIFPNGIYHCTYDDATYDRTEKGNQVHAKRNG